MSHCEACAANGRRGYCAPLRCYCGHESCHAFASWVPLRAPLANIQNLPTSSTWADREESTWIDKL